MRIDGAVGPSRMGIDQLLQAIAGAESSAALVEAVQALAAAQLPASIPTLIAVLGYNNPGAAVAAVDGLVGLGAPAVQPLLDLLDDHNYTARAWAIRALAGIGDPRSLALLLQVAQADFAMSVRRAAARGLGNLRWEDLTPSQRSIAQHQVTDVLMHVCQDPEWVVRYAAIVGLEGVALTPWSEGAFLRDTILQHLQSLAQREYEIAVQARIRYACQTIAMEP